jgi:hypothetical protein
MAEEFLDFADVGPLFEKMRGERMAQRVNPGVFGNSPTEASFLFYGQQVVIGFAEV